MPKKIYDVEMQYLTVGYAKNIGLNAAGLVQRYDAKNTSLEEEGLAPILLYSAIHPAYAIHYRKVCAAATPMAITEFLREAWDERDKEGQPLRIEIKPSLLSADQGFVAWLKDIGVQCTAVQDHKPINAHENTSQNVAIHIETANRCLTGTYIDRPVSVEYMNKGLRLDYRCQLEYFGGSNYSMDTHTFEEWCLRDRNYTHAEPLKQDWDASTLKMPVVKRPKEHLRIDNLECETWTPPEGLKEVLAMWPGGRKRLLAQVGVSAKDIDFWLACEAGLPPGVMGRLMEKVGFSYNHEYGEWSLSEGTLLVADTPRAAKEVVDVTTGGGDVELAYEALGPVGSPELPMRVYLHRGYSTSLSMMLFRRGSPVAKLLDKNKLWQTSEPLRVPQDVWNDIVSIVGCCEDLESPRAAINLFEIAHSEWLTSTGNLGDL